jgi:hypothetical protein
VLRCIAIASFALGGLNTARAQKDAPTRYKALLTLSDKGGDQDEVIKDLKKRAQSLKRTFAFRAGPKDDAEIIVTFSALGKEDAGSRPKTLRRAPQLELRKVHPEGAKLGPAVKRGKKIVPGYEHYLCEDPNSSGVTFQQDLLIAKRALVTSAHVKNAFPDPARVSVIQVELSKASGAQMRKLTEPMEKGVDRLAVVLDDKDARAPALIDTLSRKFFITGIEDHATRAAALRALFAANLR